jgi:hypothetical protein
MYSCNFVCHWSRSFIADVTVVDKATKEILYCTECFCSLLKFYLSFV